MPGRKSPSTPPPPSQTNTPQNLRTLPPPPRPRRPPHFPPPPRPRRPHHPHLRLHHLPLRPLPSPGPLRLPPPPPRLLPRRPPPIPPSDIPLLSVADNIAFISNLLPTHFWMLHHLFSAPGGFLDEVRAEISAVLAPDGVTLRVPLLHGACPLLNSTLSEVFRLHGFGMAPRVALEDVLLADRFLIRKGGMVLTPYRVQHESAEHWGDRRGGVSARAVRGGEVPPCGAAGVWVWGAKVSGKAFGDGGGFGDGGDGGDEV